MGEFDEFGLFRQTFVHPKLTFADVLNKFTRLYASKFVAQQFCQTSAKPNFCCLWHNTAQRTPPSMLVTTQSLHKRQCL